MDRALSICWYNLPEAARGTYLEWLHGRFMAKLARRPGVLWAAHYEVRKYDIPPRVRHTADAAVGRGNDYVLMLGAESSHAFARPVDYWRKQDLASAAPDLDDEDRRMLAQRTEVRESIMTEEARVDGPEHATRPAGGVPAPCIQLGSFCGGEVAEQELLSWYARWRMPAFSQLAGGVGLRKLVSVAGWAKHGVIYEFTSFDARAGAMKTMAARYPDMAEWTEQCVPRLTHAVGSPHICVRLWPAVE